MRERFHAAGISDANITAERATCILRYAGLHAVSAASEFLSLFRNYYGPTMNAFDAAEKNGKANALQNELAHLFGLNPSGRLSDRNPGDVFEGGGGEVRKKNSTFNAAATYLRDRASQEYLQIVK